MRKCAGNDVDSIITKLHPSVETSLDGVRVSPVGCSDGLESSPRTAQLNQKYPQLLDKTTFEADVQKQLSVLQMW